ncbi:MAG: SHOCT domain-containing protein [Georgenia sp.]
MGAGGWIAMAVFWVALIALIVWAVVRVFPSADKHDAGPRAETPQEILDRRFAGGELDAETYRSMQEALNAGQQGRRLP